MLIAAAVVGALTAYYFGLKVGAAAAVAAAVAFLGAMMVPGFALHIYAATAVFVLAVLVIGPRLPGRAAKRADFLSVARKVIGRALKLLRR